MFDMPMAETTVDSVKPIQRKISVAALSGEIFLGFMVLLLTVLTAVASYESGLAGSKSSDDTLAGQNLLSRANAAAEVAAQFIILDRTTNDNYVTSILENKKIESEYFKAELSPQWKKHVNLKNQTFRSGGFNAYAKEISALSTERRKESDDKFKSAGKFGEASDSYQLVVMVFALGLGMAGIGSLRKKGDWMAALFGVGAFALTVYGLVTAAGINFFEF